MKNLFSKKQLQMIGIDIGSRYIKAIALTKKGNSVSIDALACESIRGDAFQERDIQELELVSQALKKVSSRLKTKIKPAVLAVSGSTVLTKVIQMGSGQSDFELESQIEIEADSLIPYPINEVYLDFQELGPSTTMTDRSDVLLSVAHKKTVDSRSLLIEESGFEAKIFDIESYALGNAFLHFAELTQSNEPQLCLSIGAAQLQLAVVENNEIILSRELGFGADVLLAELAMTYNESKADLNEKLVQGALSEDWREFIYPQFLSNLQSQINRILQLYVSTYNRDMPNIINVCGGATGIEGLLEDLAMDMNMTLQLFDPFTRMVAGSNVDLSAFHGPQFAIAAGLASRSFEPCHI
ncbi:MAG: type IV pilus assembly protein PilM [Aestuariibacter sp.]